VPVISLLAAGLAATPVQAASAPAPPASSLPAPTAAGPVVEGMDTAQHRTAAQLLGPKIVTRVGQSSPPAAGGTGPLQYHGGQIENTPQVYLSLWGSDWKSVAYQPAIRYLQGFFANVGGSPWLGVVTQYCSASVSTAVTSCPAGATPIRNPVGQLKGTWVDTSPVSFGTPATACGFQSDTYQMGVCDTMQAAQRAANHFGPLPAGAVVMVLTPSGRSPAGFVSQGWCAYHSAIYSSGVAFGYVPYIPDAGASCGAGSVNPGGVFDGYSIVGGHEYSEAVTDPVPFTGWADAGGWENADKCAWSFGRLSNVSLGGRLYAVQQTWSNELASCQTTRSSPLNGQQLASPPAPAVFSSVGAPPNGGLTSNPSSTTWGAGRFDVAARGANNALVHCTFTGSACAWQLLGGVLTSEPAVVAWGPNRLDVFVRGTDNGLWHTFSDGTNWAGWEPLGGGLKSGPAAASWGPGRLDIFVTGTDNAVWHRFYSGGWSGWESLGGSSVSSPAAVSSSLGVVDVFTRAGDGTLQHRAFNGTAWLGWESLGGTLTWGPAVAATGIDQMAVVVLGVQGTLYRENWNGGAWSGFQSLGTAGWPSVASAGSVPDSLKVDLFATAADGTLRHAQVPA
jgi:hypothetical protein